MIPVPFQSAAPSPPSWLPMIPPDPPRSIGFWDIKNVHNQLAELQDTLSLANAMQKELEVLMRLKEAKGSVENIEKDSSDPSLSEVSKYLEVTRMDLGSQELLSVGVANNLMSKLRTQLDPFKYILEEKSQWEEKSASFRMASKIQKSKRNKLWRKRKRIRIAENLSNERNQFDQADQEADEWRAREIAKDIAQRKVDKMKGIAKLKAIEERKRLESELELVLIVEKLQELRSIRIQKLKKQGHFLPEEDDKFLERVRAAVEEEERQALAAADTDAAKDAIATAEESRKSIQNQGVISKDLNVDSEGIKEEVEQVVENEGQSSCIAADKEFDKKGSEGQIYGGVYDSVADLPVEFYHYYHGSNNDMGTLIEVRRAWDAYIRPGGSRIPGHWIHPSPPSDEIWASYLVRRN